MTSTKGIVGRPFEATEAASSNEPPAAPGRSHLTTEQYVRGVLEGDRAILARTISLVESTKATHRALADAVLGQLLPKTGGAARVGITGVPGVGKSTFIEALGTRLTARGKRVAVLAVDPSSSVSGGSILGDKTRMLRLGVDPNAFVRPSPAAGAMGGVASRTRESMLLCEAAGFDVVLIETVGVGQTETAVAEMVDFFLALMLPGAGDELQGIKRGLVELVDMIAIHKADGDNRAAAELAARQYANALHYLARRGPEGAPTVMTCSSQTGAGIEELWAIIDERWSAMRTNGVLAERRRQQNESWLNALVRAGIERRFIANPAISALRVELLEAVREGALTPVAAADRLLRMWDQQPK